MLRVLHCLYDDRENPWVGGGGAVRAFEIYRRLTDRVDATLVTGNYPGARDETIDGVRYVRVGSPRSYIVSRWTFTRAASRLLAEGAYDVGVVDFSVYAPVRLPAGRPVGLTVHHLTGPTARQRWGPLLGAAIAYAERRLLRRARWVSVVSDWTGSRLRPLLRPDAWVTRVGNGVPDELFRIQRRDEGYLLYFGRLDLFQKGIDTLLHALALLVRQRPGLELRIAGRGKDTARVRALAEELGIARNVRMLGSVSDAERLALLAGATLAVMPSRFEGFGLVAAEAMAAGVPLVATTAGALPEVVGPPEGGILVPPDDPNALAAAVAQLLDSPEQRAALSQSARRRASAHFSWDVVAQQHLEFIRRIAADFAASRSPVRP
ncbi:MAG TPA: glycosyltransferase family 4 protein [Longimicrobiales bacterium]